MLIITRKAGERVMVGDDIVVHVMELVGGSVRIGIEAPRSIPVYREEIYAAVREENLAAAEASGELPKAAEFPPRPSGTQS
jgi:carbon storage regulator